MKPENWDQLSQEEKKAIGNELFTSMRGWFLLRRALTIAIPALKHQPLPTIPFPEPSSAEDMEIFLETVFWSEPPKLVEISLNDIADDPFFPTT